MLYFKIQVLTFLSWKSWWIE